EGFTVVHGNASDVDTLRAAGVERARGLITAVDSDADNIYVTLSARTLQPDLFIVSRASLAMRPTAVDFVDTVLTANNGRLVLEDFTIREESAWIGHALGELLPEDTEAIVLAIKRAGAMEFRPPGATLLAAGDELVIAGPPQAIHLLETRL